MPTWEKGRGGEGRGKPRWTSHRFPPSSRLVRLNTRTLRSLFLFSTHLGRWLGSRHTFIQLRLRGSTRLRDRNFWKKTGKEIYIYIYLHVFSHEPFSLAVNPKKNREARRNRADARIRAKSNLRKRRQRERERKGGTDGGALPKPSLSLLKRKPLDASFPSLPTLQAF